MAMADLPVNDEVILTLRVAKARPEAETARQLKLEDEEAEKLYRCALELLRGAVFPLLLRSPQAEESGAAEVGLKKLSLTKGWDRL